MPDSNPFSPDRWAMPAGSQAVSTVRKQPLRPRHRAAKFLKGPIPWPWLQRAMMLPGKALAIGLLLWLRRGMVGQRTVHFCLTSAAADGIPCRTARRAMQQLELAGLVAIERKPGSGLNVTLLDVQEIDR